MIFWGIPTMKSLMRIALILPPLALLGISGCSSQSVTLVHPQTGATVDCSGSGFGLGAAWVESHITECTRRNENRGYVPIDKLTPEQRADLEKQGLLH